MNSYGFINCFENVTLTQNKLYWQIPKYSFLIKRWDSTYLFHLFVYINSIFQNLLRWNLHLHTMRGFPTPPYVTILKCCEIPILYSWPGNTFIHLIFYKVSHHYHQKSWLLLSLHNLVCNLFNTEHWAF